MKKTTHKHVFVSLSDYQDEVKYEYSYTTTTQIEANLICRICKIRAFGQDCKQDYKIISFLSNVSMTLWIIVLVLLILFIQVTEHAG